MCRIEEFLCFFFVKNATKFHFFRLTWLLLDSFKITFTASKITNKISRICFEIKFFMHDLVEWSFSDGKHFEKTYGLFCFAL